MKLLIEQSMDYEEIEITIKCNMLTPQLEKIIEQIRLQTFSIAAKKDGETQMIRLEDIYYFETISEKTFLYCEKDVYDCSKRMTELEDELSNTAFVRISKSAILNTMRVSSVKSLINGKFEATLDNSEKIIVNRHYLARFKEKFGL